MTASFQQLGEQVDRANAAASHAKHWILERGQAGCAAALRVEIDKATWADGTLPLQGKLEAVVRERLGDLLAEALRRLEADAKIASDQMVQAFGGVVQVDVNGRAEAPKRAPQKT